MVSFPLPAQGLDLAARKEVAQSVEQFVVPRAVAPTTDVDMEHASDQAQRERSRRKKGTRRRHKESGNCGRLWQLPQSSIEEYAKWITDKPVESQTLAEKKFLHKYNRRMLIRQHKLPNETMKQYIARLEARGNCTAIEIKVIEQYHLRKAQKRALQRKNCEEGKTEKRAVPPPLFWKRQSSKQGSSSSATTLGSLTLVANLQESMSRLGLSSEKLRDAPLAA